MRRGAAAVAAARACLGARFRPQGRQADYGYDCVGVAGAAYGIVVSGDYALRGGEAAMVAERIVAAGFVAVEAEAAAGDLVLMRAGPAQLHLGVWTGAGVVQAHAGLRRVVEVPGWPAGVAGVFRVG